MKFLAASTLAIVWLAGACGDGGGQPECQPEDRAVCWPEDGPGAEIRWLDSCGQPGEVISSCPGLHVECSQGACICLNHWEGEECTRCPDNWDSGQNCAVCRNHWVDQDNDCGTCPGNWDLGQDCAVCKAHWIDEDNDCSSCPANWDPDQDCAACLPGWTGEDCQQVALGCNDLVCTDPGSVLSWQRHSTSTVFDYYWANDYCEKLVLDGHDDWRLPTIDELRSLVRGCPPVERGGACRVDWNCLSLDCHDLNCTPEECLDWSGPGEAGCYWPAEMTGDCDESHWSSSAREDDERRMWDLRFRDAYLSWSTRDSQQGVRCVRRPAKR